MKTNTQTTKPAREAESARQAAIDRMIAAKLQATINTMRTRANGSAVKLTGNLAWENRNEAQ